MNIFVAKLNYSTSPKDLENLFEQYGAVSSARVIRDKETGKSKGFGFVEMPVAEEAKDAIESLNDISLGKKPLVVKAAEDRPGGGGSSPRPGGAGPRPGGFNSRPGGYDKPRNRY